MRQVGYGLENAISVLPEGIWEEANKQARRSTLKNFKTGAVIFHPKTGEILSKGCSHTKHGASSLASVHAEVHCIENHHKYMSPYVMFILSIGKAKNPAFSSKPCSSCTRKLSTWGAEVVYYLERLNNGLWIMNIKTPYELLTEADDSQYRIEFYAKDMRL